MIKSGPPWTPKDSRRYRVWHRIALSLAGFPRPRHLFPREAHEAVVDAVKKLAHFLKQQKST